MKPPTSLGKANVHFTSHQDALTAMDKNKTSLNDWEVNLYLHSTDDSNETNVNSFNWNKMIKSCLKSTDNNTAKLSKLVKVLHPQYTEECSAEVFQVKLEEKLKESDKFTLTDGLVSM